MDKPIVYVKTQNKSDKIKCEYSQEEFDQLYAEGQELSRYILSSVNNISSYFIHKDKVIKDASYRREEDFKEICIALALYDRLIKKNYKRQQNET
jgi:hypothetical protein